MDGESIKLNLRTIEELILDEEKLVTYIYLSKKLCLHVNESKKLLSYFTNEFRKNKPDISLNVNYIISGLTADYEARTTVCSEDDIVQTRQTLKPIFFEHIYSVNKGSPNVDSIALATVNNFSDFSSCLGLIKSRLCVKHSLNEMGHFKSQSYETSLSNNFNEAKPVERAVKTEPMEIDIDNNCNKNKIIENDNLIVKTEVTPKNKHVPVKSNKSQKGIAGFFAKQNGEVKKELKPEKTTDKPKTEDFTKKPTLEHIAETNEINKKVALKLNDDKETEVKKNKKDDKESKAVKLEQTTNKRDSTKSNSIKNIKKNAKVDKKRKRLLHISDSESESEKNDPFEEEPEKEIFESDDEIPPTPTANVVKVTSGIINPKKKKKIDKMYTDEQGYIVTKKVEVYESCSDDEITNDSKENIVKPINNKIEISPIKKIEAKKSKKKISPPQKGKQSTLTSFFKRT